MELFLRSKYKENLQDLDGEHCKQRLEAMFYFQETGTILENIDLGVKSILRQQIKEREGDRKNYDEACEKQRLKALKRWHPEEYNSIPQNATACHGIPQDAKYNNNINNNIIQEKEINKEKETRETRDDGKSKYLENVWIKDDEYMKIIKQYGRRKTDEYINKLNHYIANHGDKYKEHYLTILTWMRKANEPKLQLVDNTTNLADDDDLGIVIRK